MLPSGRGCGLCSRRDRDRGGAEGAGVEQQDDAIDERDHLGVQVGKWSSYPESIVCRERLEWVVIYPV